MPRAHCVSNSTSMTYRPLKRPLSVPSSSRKVHNLLPWNKKRCVLVTQQWCDTSGCPPFRSNLHDIKVEQPWRETHILSLQLWTVLPKNPQAFTKQYHAFHMSQSLQVRQVSKQIRQQNSTAESRFGSQSLRLSVSPLLSQKKYFTPPKNRVFLHGWFEEAQVCCVFRANAYVREPEAIVETLNSAIGKEWQFSLCFFNFSWKKWTERSL